MLIRYRNITFGGNTGPLLITDFKPVTTDLRSEYKDRLQRDGQTLSKDFLGVGSWQFTVKTNGQSLASALAEAGQLEAAWKLPSVRTSTSPQALDYSHDGGATWFRVWGKPGKVASPTSDVHARLGVAVLDLEFIQTDPNHYSATEHQATISTTPSNVGGLVAPLVAPLTTVASGEPRAGVLLNKGDLPSPARVRFYGPSSNPKITTDKGFEIGYQGTLAYDQYVTVDAVSSEVKLNNGASVAGRLNRKTRLSNLTVPAGRSEWSYQATDVSGTSKAVIYWRDAFTALQ